MARPGGRRLGRSGGWRRGTARSPAGRPNSPTPLRVQDVTPVQHGIDTGVGRWWIATAPGSRPLLEPHFGGSKHSGVESLSDVFE